MRQPEPAHRYVVLDVETTGLSPARGDRVIEIGAVAIEEGEIISEFGTLIHVEKKIHRHARQVHGITDSMLIGKPSPDEVFPELRRFISEGTVIAHNTRFDIGFINAEFTRFNLSLNNKTFCTLQAARRLYPHLPNHRLETVSRHLLRDLPENLRLHRALDDARLTARVWMEMVRF